MAEIDPTVHVESAEPSDPTSPGVQISLTVSDGALAQLLAVYSEPARARAMLMRYVLQTADPLIRRLLDDWAEDREREKAARAPKAAEKTTEP